MNPADYHPQWKEISRQIRDQADDTCEWCGRENRDRGHWGEEGEWISHTGKTLVYRRDDTPPKVVTTVLTVAHLCHETRCIDPTHLRALCQRCHLRYDREHHAKTRRDNRIRESGQLGLLEAQP